ncbi:hypothetical protein ACFL0L_04165 [Patescibacteria group bacterium]
MEPRFLKTNKNVDIILIVFFLAVLWIPMAGMVFGFESDIEEQEKRKLAEMPEFTASSILRAPFRKDFDEYFSDNFGFRSILVHAGSLLHVGLLKSSPTHQVVIGKDDWFFFGGGNVIDDFRGAIPLTDRELKSIKDNIEQQRELLANQGIDFYILVSPNKTSIYPEFLPSNIEKVGEQTRLDQIVTHLSEHSDFVIIDPREKLIKIKEKNFAYEKTGTHWNEYGAFVAYSELINEVRKNYPNIPAPDINNFELRTEIVGGSDLAILLSLQNQKQDELVYVDPFTPRIAQDASVAFENPNPNPVMPLVAKEVANNELPHALIFRDSFTNHLIPYLSEDFSRSVYVWMYKIDPEIVELEKPDIVILEVSERNLFQALYSDIKQ